MSQPKQPAPSVGERQELEYHTNGFPVGPTERDAVLQSERDFSTEFKRLTRNIMEAKRNPDREYPFEDLKALAELMGFDYEIVDR